MNADLARALLDALPWGIVIVDRDGGIVAVNRVARDRFALSADAGSDADRARLVAAYPLDPPLAVDQVLHVALDEGEPAHAIARPMRADGEEPPDRLCFHAFPMDGDDGERRAIVLLEPLPSDEDRDRAVRRLERALRRFSHARHQVNNALMSIFGNAELLLTRPDLPAPLRERASAVLDEARRIRDLMQETKSIGRED